VVVVPVPPFVGVLEVEVVWIHEVSNSVGFTSSGWTVEPVVVKPISVGRRGPCLSSILVDSSGDLFVILNAEESFLKTLIRSCVDDLAVPCGNVTCLVASSFGWCAELPWSVGSAVLFTTIVPSFSRHTRRLNMFLWEVFAHARKRLRVLESDACL
jgi:hypothetical protein